MQPSQAGLSLSKLELRNLVSRARRLSCSALHHPVSDGPFTLPLWLESHERILLISLRFMLAASICRSSVVSTRFS